MSKENILFTVVGLLLGLIVGFAGTNYLNQKGYEQAAAPQSNATTAQQQQQPQINQQVVRDQTQTGGRNGGAIPQVQQTIDRAAQEPNNFDAQMAAGDMYYKIRRYDEAAQFYDKAAQIKPNDLGALTKAGHAFYDAGAVQMESGGNGTANFQTAEKFYTRVLAINPRDVSVRTDLGLTFYYRQPKELDRAIKEYRTSLETDPNHEMTLQVLATALKEKGDAAGAQETVARLEKVNPANPNLAQLKAN
jgi:tetratricopeptide (TPR) repeat protein